MLCELISEAVSSLTNVQRREKRAGDTVNGVTRSVGEGVSDLIGAMMVVYEDGGDG